MRRVGWVALLLFSFSTCGSKKKIVMDPKDAKSAAELEEIAQTYYSWNNYPKTIATYQEIIKNFASRKDRYEKQLAWAHYEIGFCYMIQNKLDEAEKYYRIVISDYYTTLAALTLAEQRIEELKRLRNPEPNRIKKFFMKLSPRYRKKIKTEKKASSRLN